jgi:hypothetical protein
VTLKGRVCQECRWDLPEDLVSQIIMPVELDLACELVCFEEGFIEEFKHFLQVSVHQWADEVTDDSAGTHVFKSCNQSNHHSLRSNTLPFEGNMNWSLPTISFLKGILRASQQEKSQEIIFLVVIFLLLHSDCGGQSLYDYLVIGFIVHNGESVEKLKEGRQRCNFSCA